MLYLFGTRLVVEPTTSFWSWKSYVVLGLPIRCYTFMVKRIPYWTSELDLDLTTFVFTGAKSHWHILAALFCVLRCTAVSVTGFEVMAGFFCFWL